MKAGPDTGSIEMDGSQTPERFRRVDSVLRLVMALPEAERAAFLDRECEGDRELRSELESLLAHHTEASVLEQGTGNPGAARVEPAAGTHRSESQSPVGRRIGSISIERELATGGMGTVYLGYDERLRRRVALKSIRSEWRLHSEARTRFLREARILSQLKHPNICEIYGYEETPESDYLILEYIDGRSLREVMEEGKLPMRERDRIVATLAQVLQVAHGAGVVHRDLKPENVMLTHEGRVKVLDFGIACIEAEPVLPLSQLRAPESALPAADPYASHARGTRAGAIIGSLNYMSPEQARGDPVTPASDIFALGLILYELYLERPAYPRALPLQERLARISEGRIDPVPGLRRDRRRLIRHMLSPSAAPRPTATEVAQGMHRIRELPQRWTRRGLTSLVLLLSVLGVVKYIVDINLAWARAQMASGNNELVMNLLLDNILNKDSAEERRDVISRIWHTTSRFFEELPGPLQREALVSMGGALRNNSRFRLRMGDTQGALESFARAVRMDEESTRDAGGATRQAFFVQLRATKAAREGLADPAAAIAQYKLGCRFYTRMLEEGSVDVRWPAALAVTWWALGWTYLDRGDAAEALSAFQESAARYRGQLEKVTGIRSRIWRNQLGAAQQAIGEAHLALGEYDAALEAMKVTVQTYQTLTVEAPYLAEFASNLGEARLAIGQVLQARGDTAGALEAFESARSIHQPLFEADPTHQGRITQLARDHLSLARVLRLRPGAAGAEAELEKAAAVSATLTTGSLFAAQAVRAQTLLELGRVGEARPFVEGLVAVGWHRSATHRDFARLLERCGLLPSASATPQEPAAVHP